MANPRGPSASPPWLPRPLGAAIGRSPGGEPPRSAATAAPVGAHGDRDGEGDGQRAARGDASRSLPRGVVLLGTYRLDVVLGRGPSGEVHNAWDLRRHMACAVKVLHPELSALTAALVRLRHDNQEIGGLHHPHLQGGAAELHFTNEGMPVLVRELWRGTSLRQRLTRGPLGLGELCRLFVVLCGALDAAHSHGVIHGDLKPENLLLGHPASRPPGVGEDSLQVLDFGMHHLRHGEGGIGSHPLLGTLSYLAPEQLSQASGAAEAAGDSSAVDGRTDVFSLGALLYECLTGRAAFGGPQKGDAPALAQPIAQHKPPRPTEQVSWLPWALDAVVEMACHPKPDQRFTSPSALWLALRDALAGQDEVEQVLGEMRSPSAASSTAVLLPEGGFGPPTEPSADSSPSAENAPSSNSAQRSEAPSMNTPAGDGFTPAAEAPPFRRRRTSNGARAVRIFKSLEQASFRPPGEPSGRNEEKIRRAAAEEAALLLDSATTRAAREAQRQQIAQREQDIRRDPAATLRLPQIPAALAMEPLGLPLVTGPPATTASDPPMDVPGDAARPPSIPDRPSSSDEPTRRTATDGAQRSGPLQPRSSEAEGKAPFTAVTPPIETPYNDSEPAASARSDRDMDEMLAEVQNPIFSLPRLLPILVLIGAIGVLVILLTRSC